MKFGGDGVVVVTLGEVVVTRGFADVLVVVVTLAFVEFVELSAIALRKFTIKTININFSFIAFNFFFLVLSIKNSLHRLVPFIMLRARQSS